MWAPLVGLSVAAFIFNTSEFIPTGLLSDIAASFALNEAQAGTMISVYALAVLVLSVPLMVVCSRFDPKRLLLGVIGLFLAGQVLSAVAPTFELLVAARLLVAAAHAVFWSIASPYASRIVDESHASLAMSMVVTGTSVAMILGMPLGRVIGLALGWRMTFVCVAVVAGAVLLLLAAVMPRLDRGEPFSVRELPSLMKNGGLVAIYVATVLVATGYYTGYSYIEPFMQQVAHLAAGEVTAALTVFGCAGIVGSLLFSRCFDGHRAAFIRIMVGGVAAALALMLPASASFASACAVCALWGLCATAFNVAFQAEIIRLVPPEAAAVAVSIFSGLFNLGISLGTWLGGTVVTGPGIGLVGVVGAAVAFAGLVCCVMLIGRPRRGVSLSR